MADPTPTPELIAACEDEVRQCEDRLAIAINSGSAPDEIAQRRIDLDQAKEKLEWAKQGVPD